MHGHNRKAIFRKLRHGTRLQQLAAGDFCRSPGSGNGALRFQGVDHDVADKSDSFVGNAFGLQIGVGNPVGREQQVRQPVGDEPVDFLGHVDVTGTQARLDVGELYVFFFGDDGAGAGGVDVADHDDPVRLFRLDHLFEFDHGSADLFGMTARPDVEVDVRLGDAEIDEK
ncbi:hypothetical protein SDC9_120913 [bioreactor metagenome]|uniref:Uncharacterized protein n=1 Tax=bioreactor metagenome TaxID=1076179 RepID=A0A645CAJ7_9ZZZZ